MSATIDARRGANPALEVAGLGYRYPGAVTDALRGIDLSIEAGEFVVLAGRSGCGKTTLLRAASGLVPHFHGGRVEGRIVTAGLDVREHGPAQLASVVGYLFQDPESQVVSTTVAAELETPLTLRGVGPAERARTVEETALALGLADLIDRQTSTLSGGELQRVAVAAALVTRPSLLLLDEPTSQLDPVAGDELISLLHRVNRDAGVAVLLCEHRLERCLAGADRAVALAGGSVTYDGTPDGLLAHAIECDPEMATPGARLCAGLGIAPRSDLRAARAAVISSVDGEGRSFATAQPSTPMTRAPRPEHCLVAEDLRVTLAGNDAGEGAAPRPALDGASLTIHRGERVAVMGANGAGKTTLLRTAAGLLDPDAGRVLAPDGIALLPQRPDSMFVRERVGDELPGRAGAEALSHLGLDGFEDRDLRDLSGGERERLALALVLAGRLGPDGLAPGALLLDEPTRGLDRGRKADLADLVTALAERGSGLLVATHDVEFAALFAERVVILGRGQVVADGPATELLARGLHFSTEVARITGGSALTAEQALGAAASEVARSAALDGSPSGASPR